MKASGELIRDTKQLANRTMNQQDKLAELADGSLKRMVQLSEAVKAGASSLKSNNSEAQVMLLNSVKDVAASLHDLLQSRKTASTKTKTGSSDKQLTESAKVL